MRTPATDRRGVTLVLVLLLVIVASISAAAAFTRTGAEGRSNSAIRAQVAAFAAAQGGIERFLRTTPVSTLPSTLPATSTYTDLPGNMRASVTLYRVRASGPDTLYLVRSIGTAPGASALDTRAGVARRAIVQLVKREAADIDAPAAFISLSGLQIANGASGTVSGINRNPSCGPNVPGLAVPNNQYVPPSNGNTRGQAGDYIQGAPPNPAQPTVTNAPVFLGPETQGGPGGANAAVDIDWAGVLDGSVLDPDFVFTRTDYERRVGGGENYPVVRFEGNLTSAVNITGQGILIVTGDADLSNVLWTGIVLVGGQSELSGSRTRVFGALFSGLNMLIPGLSSYPSTDRLNGATLVQYDACAIERALSQFTGWRRIPNAWTDNYPSNN